VNSPKALGKGSTITNLLVPVCGRGMSCNHKGRLSSFCRGRLSNRHGPRTNTMPGFTVRGKLQSFTSLYKVWKCYGPFVNPGRSSRSSLNTRSVPRIFESEKSRLPVYSISALGHSIRRGCGNGSQKILSKEAEDKTNTMEPDVNYQRWHGEKITHRAVSFESKIMPNVQKILDSWQSEVVSFRNGS
jgi:hypothetical protein